MKATFGKVKMYTIYWQVNVDIGQKKEINRKKSSPTGMIWLQPQFSDEKIVPLAAESK